MQCMRLANLIPALNCVSEKPVITESAGASSGRERAAALFSHSREGARLARPGDMGWAGSSVAAGPRDDCFPEISGKERSLNTARHPLSLGANAAGAAEERAGPRRCLGKLGPIRAVPGLPVPGPSWHGSSTDLSCPGLKPPIGLKWAAVAAGGAPAGRGTNRSSFLLTCPSPFAAGPARRW